MKTQSGGDAFNDASWRMPSSVSVVLPVILSLRSIQYADGSSRIEVSVSRTVPLVAFAMDESSSSWYDGLT
jgi:hypothetical protein